MIIVRASHRVSLWGGGSDYPEFISKYDYGCIISCAIDSYAYVCVKKLLPFHKYKTKITYDKKERVYLTNKYIRHHIFRNCIQFMGLEDEPLEINFISDVPGGSGLGTGSTMIVALLKALYEYKNEDISQEQLFKNASYIERSMMNEPAGYQDYLPAIYGGFRYYTIRESLEYNEVLPSNFAKFINENGLLFYTGISRKSSEVINKYLPNIACDSQLKIRQIAEDAYEEITGGFDCQKIYHMINLSQSLKETISPAIVTPDLKEKIDLLRTAGCEATRLLGGGGGGCIFAFVPPELRYNTIGAATKAGMVEIPFSIAARGCERIL